MKQEYKSFDFELKETAEDKEFFFFEGYAATFHDIDSYGDRIMPGAFTESLQVLRPTVLWQHSTREPIGISVQETEDMKGLFVKAKLPKADTFVSGRVIPQMKIKSVNKLSIGFSAEEYSYEKVDGYRWEIRNITKAKLYEYSPVSIPANMAAVITGTKNGALFTLEDVRDISTKERFDRFLKRSGIFTKSAREHLAKFLPKQSDSDREEIEAMSTITDDMKKFTKSLRG